MPLSLATISIKDPSHRNQYSFYQIKIEPYPNPSLKKRKQHEISFVHDPFQNKQDIPFHQTCAMHLIQKHYQDN